MQATNEISPEGQSETLTALVAEDEVILRMILSEHLRETGFIVLEAANGAEARKIITAVEFVDVVISDVHMAAPSEGIDLARWLGEHYPGLPVILASGSRSVAEGEAWKTGTNVTDFVPKPYSVQHIERLARARIAGRNASPK